MDPYLEHPARWPDVHHSPISIVSRLLAERQRLPVIAVPLRPGDPTADLDLQLALNMAYARAGTTSTSITAATPPRRFPASWPAGRERWPTVPCRRSDGPAAAPRRHDLRAIPAGARSAAGRPSARYTPP